jgi:hypothetical protein
VFVKEKGKKRTERIPPGVPKNPSIQEYGMDFFGHNNQGFERAGKADLKDSTDNKM